MPIRSFPLPLRSSACKHHFRRGLKNEIRYTLSSLRRNAHNTVVIRRWHTVFSADRINNNNDVKTCASRSVLRPHRMNTVQRCGLLLPMSLVAWSACLSVSMLVTLMCCAKTAELIKMSFRGRGPRNQVLDGDWDLFRKGQVLGLCCPLKIIGSFCSDVCSKRIIQCSMTTADCYYRVNALDWSMSHYTAPTPWNIRPLRCSLLPRFLTNCWTF